LKRIELTEERARQWPFKSGEVEVDESYFGPRRVCDTSHVNVIESFRSMVKRGLRKLVIITERVRRRCHSAVGEPFAPCSGLD
jgi:hypothetical protein